MQKFDFLIIGSGFSGSISAMCLKKMGYSVCLVEKEQHPRFAIGESSTPIADMILRDLADEYDLPFLKKLSRYGEWQKNYPQITCGLKRGFSYYHPKKGERFYSDENHSKELLVAASEDNENSDTHWLRSDVDHFLVKQAVELGVCFWDQTEVKKLKRDSEKESWSVFLETRHGIREMECEWIIDASGSPNFSTKFFQTKNSSSGFKTNSSAIYTHFEKVNYWSKYLESKGFNTSDYPYNPDFSALHHLIDEGWIWMLRFNNNRLSTGILFDETTHNLTSERKPIEKWKWVMNQYPSLKTVFSKSKIANPPKQFIETERLQRQLNRVYGDGWLALPHTAGFVDPLHSTGIAFSLSGIERVLKIFKNEKISIHDLKKYQEKIFNELHIIDLIISLGYKTRQNFELFSASTMLYFIASIRYEKSRLNGEIPDTFLCAGESEIKQMIQDTFAEMENLHIKTLTESEIKNLVDTIRKRIEPYNTVGLMEPEAKNMYWHTTVKL